MQTVNKIKVLVSGGSIAGSTVAYWLARAGYQPTVVEHAPALRMGGNGVDVRGLAKGDHQLGFKRFEEGYRQTVERSQSQLFIGLLVPKTHLAIWARNAFTKLPIMGTLANLERMLTPPESERLPEFEAATL